MNIYSPVVAERFWSKVDVRQASKCWAWKGSLNQGGYGNFMMERKVMKAARVAYWLRNGVWPDNACHHCDNPRCCNPDHIFSVTHKQNMEDRNKKGRHMRGLKGENHPQSLLTEDQVISIRKEYGGGESSMACLAELYKCSFTTIQRVVRRETWKHI